MPPLRKILSFSNSKFGLWSRERSVEIQSFKYRTADPSTGVDPRTALLSPIFAQIAMSSTKTIHHSVLPL